MEIRKAVRHQRKGRIALCGPTGAGKTYDALVAAQQFGGKIGLIDTENFSASLYSDLAEFDVIDLVTFGPDDYMRAIEMFAQGGYPVLVIDSFSHAWAGKNGILQKADEAAKRMKNPNSYTAWREATPLHEALVSAVMTYPGHVIVTMRSKMDYSQEKTSEGRTVIRKVGMAPVQRDGVEYEFDIVCDIDVDHNLVVSKTRFPEIADAVINKPNGDFWKKIYGWLNSGDAAPDNGKPPQATDREKMLASIKAGESIVYPAEKAVEAAHAKYLGGATPETCEDMDMLKFYLDHMREKAKTAKKEKAA